MTDVTGFGLFGHLGEICKASGLSAELTMSAVPIIKQAEFYRKQNAIPGGTHRNFESYGNTISNLSQEQLEWGCDPQTSGGLLVCVEKQSVSEFLALAKANQLELTSSGRMIEQKEKLIYVS